MPSSGSGRYAEPEDGMATKRLTRAAPLPGHTVWNMDRKSIRSIPRELAWLLFIFLIHMPAYGQSHVKKEVFARKNLVAWCIVPFDAKERTPEERAAMLQRLGITKLAYDWRDKHIPTFDQEWKALKTYGIRLEAFWMTSGKDPAGDPRIQSILAFLERNKVQTDIWLYMTGEAGLHSLSQDEKIREMAGPIRYIADRAQSLGCRVSLYNHGGWFGEPENQVALLDYLKLPNLGIVYNFHHARVHLERFPDFFPKILPYLTAVNLAGLKKGETRRFFRVGEGDAEKEMIQLIGESGYQGAIGIIGHDEKEDAEKALVTEMKGLKNILEALGNTEAARTYD